MIGRLAKVNIWVSPAPAGYPVPHSGFFGLFHSIVAIFCVVVSPIRAASSGNRQSSFQRARICQPSFLCPSIRP